MATEPRIAESPTMMAMTIIWPLKFFCRVIASLIHKEIFHNHQRQRPVVRWLCNKKSKLNSTQLIHMVSQNWMSGLMKGRPTAKSTKSKDIINMAPPAATDDFLRCQSFVER